MRHAHHHYSRLSITMHWLMLAVIALAYLFIELRTLFPRGSPERDLMRMAHTSLGLLVLAMVMLRLLARWQGGTPPIVPPLPAWQRAAAWASHGLLYALMIGMPIAGWVLLSLRGDPVVFFGLTLPPIAAEDKALAKLVRSSHGTAGQVGYGLIGLHAAAALFHHFLRRDDTLRRMLPGGLKPSSPPFR